MTPEQVAAFWAEYERIQEVWPTQREGQAMMNTLYQVDRDAYDLVHMSELDPFYLDERLPDFREALGLGER